MCLQSQTEDSWLDQEVTWIICSVCLQRQWLDDAVDNDVAVAANGLMTVMMEWHSYQLKCASGTMHSAHTHDSW